MYREKSAIDSITQKLEKRYENSDMIFAVLEWVYEQQTLGNKPNDFDVAKHFNISLREAVEIHDELEREGEC